MYVLGILSSILYEYVIAKRCAARGIQGMGGGGIVQLVQITVSDISCVP